MSNKQNSSTISNIYTSRNIILDLVNGKKPKINEPKLIKVLRYYEEVVVWNF